MVPKADGPISAPSGKPPALVGADLERCIYCEGTAITRAGRRYKKFETIQLWYCAGCQCTFTARRAKGKTYPLKVILEALVLYYRGHTRAQVARQIRERFGLTVPARTLSAWLAEYRGLTTYARLRQPVAASVPVRQWVRTIRLHHQQVYQYGIHQGKLAAILQTNEHAKFKSVATFLAEMAQSCPHHLFQSDARASQHKVAFNLDAVQIKVKRNHACRIADLVLQTVVHHKRRHDELQRFMLATDSVTVAVEVPIILTREDVAYWRDQRRYEVPIEAGATVTGHIDFLQIRNGRIHILDYKPGARSEKPIAQLMMYALALSRRTRLRLFDFVCAWFDEHHYYEFYPLHVVHKER